MDRDCVRELLRDRAGLGRARVLCSRCGLTEDTGPCCGCARCFCASCCEYHFDANSLEYFLGLRLEPARAEDGQPVDPLQVLVNSKTPRRPWLPRAWRSLSNRASNARRTARCALESLATCPRE
jgi:hypothetical protein